MTAQEQMEDILQGMQALLKSSSNPQPKVEDYLADAFRGLPPEQRLAALDELIDALDKEPLAAPAKEGLENHILEKLVSLLLGHDEAAAGCSSEELLDRLVKALNTVFDSLNELILGINSTFMGQGAAEQTIRLVIRSNVEGEGEQVQLQNYLSQVKQAFSVMYDAFKQAAHKKMAEVLEDIAPAHLETQVNGGLKMGPFRKAELFEVYEQKHETLENWLKKGMFMDSFLREFEKISQTLYSQKVPK